MARIKLDHSKDWIEWLKFGVGFVLYVLWNREQPMPLGFVWGIAATKNRFEVYGSYVPAFARRLGVRTALNEKIHEHFDLITTVSGSKDGGMAFMKATGYRYSKETDGWYLHKKP
jgi:hypothetical protein